MFDFAFLAGPFQFSHLARPQKSFGPFQPLWALSLVLALTWAFSLVFPSRLTAQSLTLDRSPFLAKNHDFEASFLYPGLVLVPDDPAELEIFIANRGLSGDTFLVEVTQAPQDWSTELRRFNTVITGLFLSGEESVSLTLAASPPGGQEALLPEGDHKFGVKITSLSGGKSIESHMILSVAGSKLGREALTISTSYPEIGGPSDGKFAFSMDIRNNSPEDALVNLLAEVPQDWEYSFKPGYEDKQISSIQVPKGQNRTVTLDLSPAYQAPVGSYKVKVKAEQPKGTAETDLTINLTGTYKIRVVSSNELLSTTAEVGQSLTLTLFLINEGSAPQREVSFLAIKPDNWQVEFEPQTIQNLLPNSTPVQVDLTITSAPNALVGDYGLGLSVQGEKAQAALDFRVTLKAGSAWTWLGAILIVAAVAGLSLAFLRLGRR
ncbi:MAG: hypothetical protein LBE80_09885 [Deltaproteobacteria bacterium]|jgi:uncharacterized membrane protein|nr:hypothetical protein [Deltaproteobacteria bacterium]